MLREALTFDRLSAMAPDEAAAYFITRREEGLTESEHHLFAQWLKADEAHARVQVGLAGREPLGQRQREARLDQHVQAPALDLGLLVLSPHGCLDRLGHECTVCSCCL